ncbi:myosin-11 [Diplogelasinospora grovesii]|uniref:Myosin-11 n=1 Tax=Diplogelasinospora grovesii TaxID=303347 RepID=A0AAN6NEV0_9PEZI|nr:myosin-11 [Diplogelasinospora grovesii]
MADRPATEEADLAAEDGDAMEEGNVVALKPSQPTALRCCCGREECVFLRHNCSVLASVERDVHTAAKMGQTLLARHEAYMISAERDRVELTARVEELEHDNTELEVKNKFVTDEAQSLRDTLEELNETIKDADTRIGVLEATLRDAQLEVRRLEAAAARAANLERHIALLEEEQLALQNTLVHTQEEARTTVHRWRQAERGIIDLQEQLERMEKEAREERERHVEVLSRMERQRVMEKELDTAAGRLRGAAAAKAMTDSKAGRNVVSHFVRDLLQDNATLQLGMAELREMLINSNDEIQMLREQLLYHQPMHQPLQPLPYGQVSASSTSTLRAELHQREPPSPPTPKVSQELHVHHHYHVTHKPEPKKPRKKRQGLTPGIFTPPHISAPSTPMPQPGQWQLSHEATMPGYHSHHSSNGSTSTISMPSNNARWSAISENPSEFAPSSVPSSPQSNARDSSMFDRSLMDMSSIPTSPITSMDPMSPAWRSPERKRASGLSIRTGLLPAAALFSPSSPHGQQSGRPLQSPGLSQPHPLANIICEEQLSEITAPYTTEDIPDPPPTMSSPDIPAVDTSAVDADADVSDSQLTDSQVTSPDLSSEAGHFDPHVEQRPGRRRALRRMISHESIMSLSNGMDIHTLHARPSQLTLRPLGLTAAGTNLSSVTVARPTIARGSTEGKRGSMIVRESLAGNLAGLAGLPLPKQRDTGRTVSSPVAPQNQGLSRSKSTTRQRPSGVVGRLVSWRPWGGGSGANTQAQPSPESTPEGTPALGATPTIATPVVSAVTAVSVVSASSSLKAVKSVDVSPSASLQTTSTTSLLSTASGGSGTARNTALLRAPGINQPGIIPGFDEYFAAHKRKQLPAKVSPDDPEQVGQAMREALEDG